MTFFKCVFNVALYNLFYMVCDRLLWFSHFFIDSFPIAYSIDGNVAQWTAIISFIVISHLCHWLLLLFTLLSSMRSFKMLGGYNDNENERIPRDTRHSICSFRLYLYLRVSIDIYGNRLLSLYERQKSNRNATAVMILKSTHSTSG